MLRKGGFNQSLQIKNLCEFLAVFEDLWKYPIDLKYRSFVEQIHRLCYRPGEALTVPFARPEIIMIIPTH
jgi:hypothetical protein